MIPAVLCVLCAGYDWKWLKFSRMRRGFVVLFPCLKIWIQIYFVLLSQVASPYLIPACVVWISRWLRSIFHIDDTTTADIFTDALRGAWLRSSRVRNVIWPTQCIKRLKVRIQNLSHTWNDHLQPLISSWRWFSISEPSWIRSAWHKVNSST